MCNIGQHELAYNGPYNGADKIMSKKIERLTETAVRKAGLGRNGGVGMHADGAGLWLRVSQAKDDGLCKSWVLRYAAIESDEERRLRKERGERQKERQTGLGAWPEVSLKEARAKAKELRQQRGRVDQN